MINLGIYEKNKGKPSFRMYILGRKLEKQENVSQNNQKMEQIIKSDHEMDGY